MVGLYPQILSHRLKPTMEISGFFLDSREKPNKLTMFYFPNLQPTKTFPWGWDICTWQDPADYLLMVQVKPMHKGLAVTHCHMFSHWHYLLARGFKLWSHIIISCGKTVHTSHWNICQRASNHYHTLQIASLTVIKSSYWKLRTWTQVIESIRKQVWHRSINLEIFSQKSMPCGEQQNFYKLQILISSKSTWLTTSRKGLFLFMLQWLRIRQFS